MSYLTARGWLTEKERKFIYNTAAATRMFATLLNIGVEYGASVVCMLEGNPTAKVWALDLITSKYEGPISGNLELVLTGSVEFVGRQPSKALYDFALVDGDHSYNGAYQDAVETGQRIRKNGIIAFHDCYSWEAPGKPHAICPEVTKAVDDWFETNKDKFEELPYIDSIRAFRRKE